MVSQLIKIGLPVAALGLGIFLFFYSDNLTAVIIIAVILLAFFGFRKSTNSSSNENPSNFFTSNGNVSRKKEEERKKLEEGEKGLEANEASDEAKEIENEDALTKNVTALAKDLSTAQITTENKQEFLDLYNMIEAEFKVINEWVKKSTPTILANLSKYLNDSIKSVDEELNVARQDLDYVSKIVDADIKTELSYLANIRIKSLEKMKEIFKGKLNIVVSQTNIIQKLSPNLDSMSALLIQIKDNLTNGKNKETYQTLGQYYSLIAPITKARGEFDSLRQMLLANEEEFKKAELDNEKALNDFDIAAIKANPKAA